MSVVFHSLLAVALIVGPQLPMFQPTPEELEQRQAELEREREAASRRMVFVRPRMDMPAERPPERAELSDLDRQAQAPQVPRTPENPLPYSLGNSSERAEAELAERARGAEETPQPQPEAEEARTLPPADSGFRRAPAGRAAACDRVARGGVAQSAALRTERDVQQPARGKRSSGCDDSVRHQGVWSSGPGSDGSWRRCGGTGSSLRRQW